MANNVIDPSDPNFAPVSTAFVKELAERAQGKPRGCTLHVTNCPANITLTELKEFFSILGEVAGVVRGEYYHRVEFKSEESATKCVALDGTELVGRKLKISMELPKKPIDLKGLTSFLCGPDGKIMPQNLTFLFPGTTGCALPEALSTPQTPQSAAQKMAANLNAKLGISTPDILAGPGAPSAAALAAAAAAGILPTSMAMAGGVPDALRGLLGATDKTEEVKRTVYIGNLNPQITIQMLEQFFAMCGTIAASRMADTGDATSRFGFIEFTNTDASAKALALNGTLLGDRPLKVNPANNAIVKATNPRPANPLAPGSLLNQVVAGNAILANPEQPLYTGSGTVLTPSGQILVAGGGAPILKITPDEEIDWSSTSSSSSSEEDHRYTPRSRARKRRYSPRSRRRSNSRDRRKRERRRRSRSRSGTRRKNKKDKKEKKEKKTKKAKKTKKSPKK